MGKIKSIKEKIQKARTKVWVLERSLERVREERKETCKHPKDRIKIKQQSYQETMPPSSPIHWEEKVCGRCGKVLATRSRREVSGKWQTKEK